MLILASTSPRRQEIIRRLGIPFLVEDSGADEAPIQKSLLPKDIPLEESRLKAYAVASRHPDDEVLACDTVVILEGRVLGKPKSREEAIGMLLMEQGKRQIVLTGYTFLSRKKEITRSVMSQVFFNRLSREEIEAYLDKYRPYDKAGAYGIQDEAGLINRIEGSYCNVMGFPLEDIAFRVYGRDPKSLK
ncbi:MAG: Maf family protein [Bacilli bacterium]|jgi:septum formation protein|nr:Maf family protein [Bacilli bacterium]